MPARLARDRVRRWAMLCALSLLGGGLGCGAVPRVLGLPPTRAAIDHVDTVMVAMRDGVRLHTDVYLPEGAGPFPTLVLRNPYNMMNNFGPLARLLCSYGYAVVHQDVRGRFGSEGNWEPLFHERNDGVDTLAWLVAQPWQNGNIALVGASYLSAVIWAVADVLPPQVKTIVPMIISTDLRQALYENGMFRHEVFTFWAALMPDRSMDLFNAVNYQQMIRSWPPLHADERFLGARLDWYREWLSSVSEPTALWQREDYRHLLGQPERVTVPTLMLSGWYDIFTGGQLEDFARLASRDRSRLIVGPWTHLMGLAGDGDKATPDGGTIAAQFGRILNWLDHHLRGDPLEDWGPVATYDMGAGRWVRRAAWPPAGHTVSLYLRNAERANDCAGGGLAASAPAQQAAVTYDYDPRHPAPSRGGSGLLAFVMPGWGGVPPSNRDQSGLCERSDVLTFRTAPVSQPLPIAGRARVVLRVASSAVDTAFTAKLIEVDADGLAVNMVDGITSLAYRNGATVPQPYAPTAPVTVAIDLPPVEWTLQPGTRLRLDVSSSNFPAYHAHANRGGPWALVQSPVVATQTVFVGGAEPSQVILPVAVP